MNFKKLLALSSLLCLSQYAIANKDQKITLQSPLLKMADETGAFNRSFIEVLQTRIDISKLIQGEQIWSGAVVNFEVKSLKKDISIYIQRPEIIYGAEFVVLAPDHELAPILAARANDPAVGSYIAQLTGTSLYNRQMHSAYKAVFSQAYATHPLTNKQLPIYISDYAIECFDMRKAGARLGIPAHNSKDFEFARMHNLPITVVVDIQSHLKGHRDSFGPIVPAPLLNKEGNLVQAYLGEYAPCILVNSGAINTRSLKDGAASVIQYLQDHRLGHAHKEPLLYTYNNETYSIKDLAKIESVLQKNALQTPHLDTLKKELAINLNYIQADFFAICEKFLINIKNIKTLMVTLIEEDCKLRNNMNSYLLQWAQVKGEIDEKTLFKKDITTIKNFILFCKDLVNFLGDFVHSCPKTYDNIKRQNQ